MFALPDVFEMCLLCHVIETFFNSFAVSISLQAVLFALWHITAFVLKCVNIVVKMLSYVMNRCGVGKDMNRHGVGNLKINHAINC